MNTPTPEEKPEEQPQKMSLEDHILTDSFSKAQCAKDCLIKETETFTQQTKIGNISSPTRNHLVNLLGDSYINTRSNLTIKGLLDILYTQMDEQSIKIQKKTQQKYIDEGTVTPGPQRLSENKRKELVASRSFFHLVQLAFSPEECYLSATSLSPEDPHYRDAVVICPSKIKHIYKQIGLNHLHADCSVFKSLLSKFVPLKYTFQGEERITNRIGTINDKALCFGVATIPFKEEEPLTPGERKKKEYIPFAQVFDNVYDLQGDQKQILTNFDKKLTDQENVNEQVKALFDAETDGLRARYVDTKDGQKRRQLKELFEQFQNETSFYTRTALLFQFRKIAGQNIEKDNQHLLAGLRQLGKRGEEIANMFSLISAQLAAIEEEYMRQEKVLTEILSSLNSLLYVYPQIEVAEINKALARYLVEAEPYDEKAFAMEPYSSFYDQLALLAGPLKDIPNSMGEQELKNPIATQDRFISLQFIFLSISAQHKAYELENKLKTGKIHFSEICPEYLKKEFPIQETHKFIQATKMSNEFSIHELSDLLGKLLGVKTEKSLYKVLEKIQKHEIV